jgi:hypothetical protein
MPIITQIVCGGCGAVKKEANHWFAVSIVEQGMTIRPLNAALQDREASGKSNEEYYCGQKCALEVVAQWMDGPRPQALPF